MKLLKSEIIIYTFIVTFLWDIILRYMSLYYKRLPKFVNSFLPFLQSLVPYFQYHTILAAALIAGFVGAITQVIILEIISFPNGWDFNEIVSFLVLSFLVSALIGIPMKKSGLFPKLNDTYYKYLDKNGIGRSMYHDGVSGIIVQISLLLILNRK